MGNTSQLGKMFSSAQAADSAIGMASFSPDPTSFRITYTGKNFEFLRGLALKVAGISLADHKRSMVFRRLVKRVASKGFESFDQYCNYLSSPAGEAEVQQFVNALTTNKTDFFREIHHFEHFAAYLKRQSAGLASRRLRIWSAGCSSGQEPYSIAMSLLEHLPNIRNSDVRILATDIDTDILAKAERGIFQHGDLEGLPKGYLAKYSDTLTENLESRKVTGAVRDLVTFRKLNLHSDWPMRGPFDVIFCRNVVIYFDKQAQRVLFDRFANLLSDGGILYIGHSESLFRVTERFRSDGQSAYRKIS